MKMEIKIIAGDKQIVLTEEQAKRLCRGLNKVFKNDLELTIQTKESE